MTGEKDGPAASEREELSRLRGTLDAIREGFQIVDADWRYRYLNAAAALQGRRAREELLGKTMMECYPGIERTELFGLLRRCAKDGRPRTLENEFEYPDGTKAWFELRVESCPEGLAIFSLDITERKRLEAQLRQTQKMEAVGRLAGGVAHDFNNVLSVILTCAELAIAEQPPGSPALADLEEIRKAGKRAGALTRQILALSRRRVVEARILDLNEVLSGMEGMVRRLVGESVSVEIATRPLAGRIKADPGNIEQVILNLAVNARDAMPQGGRMTIETDTSDLDEDYARSHLDARPGPHAVLAVSDTGVGMDPQTQERVFEPFFSTKGPGKGTGLGLSIVYGIVKQAGGNIWVYSEPGKGTTFKVHIPYSEETGGRPAPPIPALSAPAGGSETILVVEDDPQVLAVACAVLERKGYRVLQAGRPAEAVSMSRRVRDEVIHLLLSDIVMPEMSGPQLAGKLRADRRDMKVLFMSGYAESAAVHNHALEAGLRLLQKPLTPGTLLAKVRESLDAPAEGARRHRR